ncbi:aldose 1-epimerase, partial [Streptomyces sp. SID8455]|nr:aldose 1-epimerase [Streptomyces sp. SID8455]
MSSSEESVRGDEERARNEVSVRLTAGDAELTVDPAHGCRISSLRIGSTE